jgi:hypothetical protein
MTLSSLRFSILGSTGNVYEIAASRQGPRFTMNCTCEAAVNGLHCRHRMALLDGECTDLVSGNQEDVEKLKILFEGTDAQRYYRELVQLEAELEALKKQVKNHKHAFARAMSS